MSTSSIEWTDRVWNPVTGCTKVSPGCAHCYAETIAKRKLPHGGFVVRNFDEVLTHPERLAQPLSWRKPQRIFVNSMSDLFHEDVPDSFIDRVFAVMALTPRHTYQVLTKRPKRMLEYCRTIGRHHLADRVSIASREFAPAGEWTYSLGPNGWHLPNVWLGVSVENQRFADERIPLLCETPAAVRFISAEPLLGPIRFARVPGFNKVGSIGKDLLWNFWVIVGGESGPGARPCDIGWVRSIVEQCQRASVPVFVKQLGAVPVMPDAEWRAAHPTPLLSATNHRRVSADLAPLKLYDRKGGNPTEWPADLWVRQFPEVTDGSRR